MNALRALLGVLMLTAIVNVSVAAEPAKDKRVDVPPVTVPEKTVIQPTPAEIHSEAPPEQTCTSCHGANAVDAERKPLTHFLTTKDCSTCHFNKSWVPLRNYTHNSPKYTNVLRNPNRRNPMNPGQIDANPDPLDCSNCHFSNNEFIAK